MPVWLIRFYFVLNHTNMTYLGYIEAAPAQYPFWWFWKIQHCFYWV